MTDGRWQYANRLRRGVSRSIDVAECISRNIVVSVIGPQSAGDETFAKGKASSKGKASTKRLAEAAVTDRKAVTRKAATDKMGAASPGAVTESAWGVIVAATSTPAAAAIKFLLGTKIAPLARI
jgi:hypothetical protein